MVDWKKIALFAGGTLFGTAGVKILASDDAKKVYTPVSYTHLLPKTVQKIISDQQDEAGKYELSAMSELQNAIEGAQSVSYTHLWVRVANQHRAIAEEIILKELIYV